MQQYHFIADVRASEDATNLCLLINAYTNETTSRISGFSDETNGVLFVDDEIYGTITDEFIDDLTEFYYTTSTVAIRISDEQGNVVCKIPKTTTIDEQGE